MGASRMMFSSLVCVCAGCTSWHCHPHRRKSPLCYAASGRSDRGTPGLPGAPREHHDALMDRAERMHVEWRNVWLHTSRRVAEDLVEGRTGAIEAQRRIERLAEVYRGIMSGATRLIPSWPCRRVTPSPSTVSRRRAVSRGTSPFWRPGAWTCQRWHRRVPASGPGLPGRRPC